MQLLLPAGWMIGGAGGGRQGLQPITLPVRASARRALDAVAVACGSASPAALGSASDCCRNFPECACQHSILRNPPSILLATPPPPCRLPPRGARSAALRPLLPGAASATPRFLPAVPWLPPPASSCNPTPRTPQPPGAASSSSMPRHPRPCSTAPRPPAALPPPMAMMPTATGRRGRRP